MPIYTEKDQVTIVMGDGDVMFVRADTEDAPTHKQLLFMQDTQCNEIGSVMEYERWESQYLSKPTEDWDMPVRIIFEKPEPVLSLITTLQELYSDMKDANART